jgi:phosphoserine phosphatase RsbU/P
VNRLAQGALAIGRGELDTRIQVKSRDEIGLLADSFNDMAANLKIAQEEKIKKQLMVRELSIAHEIQSRLIPKTIPRLRGYELLTYYQSAEEIGGDYFDVLNLAPMRHGLVVADVSGKGVPGSLGMAVTRSEFRAFARHYSGASEPLKKTNESIFPDIKGELFVSMFYAILDESNHTLLCASAGHNPAYWVKADGSVVEVKPSGAALGLFQPDYYTLIEEKISLNVGDLFVLYTDGITEAKNLAKDEYGEDRFVECLKAGARMDMEKLKASILADILAFTKDAPQHDDMTLLAIRRSV